MISFQVNLRMRRPQKEDNILTVPELAGTDQYVSENSSDVFLGPAAETFVRLQRDSYQ